MYEIVTSGSRPNDDTSVVAPEFETVAWIWMVSVPPTTGTRNTAGPPPDVAE